MQQMDVPKCTQQKENKGNAINNMHWKVACAHSPTGAAVKQFKYGFIMREVNGSATFFTYKDFPRVNRPATEEELQQETGWAPLTKKLQI